MAKKTFKTKRLSSSVNAVAGTGSLVVAVDFVPDFIRVTESDVHYTATKGTLSYSFTSTGDPASPYELNISWSIPEPRKISYVVAKLPVSFEQTIAFGNG